MKRFMSIIILAVVLVFASLSYAQQEIDDCFNYIKAGDYYRAIEAGKRAVKLYPKNSDAHFCLGKAYRLIGEFDYALKSMKESERLTTNKSDLMYTYNWLGSIYYGKGDIDNALFYHSKDLSLSRELGNKNEEAKALNNIAIIYSDRGEFDKALDYYEQSLKLRTKEEDKSTPYNNIATIYSKKGNLNKAIEYLKKAVDVRERTGDYHGVAKSMLNLGDTYRLAKDFDRAFEYLNDGLKRIQKIGDKYWEGYAYKYLGWLYKDKGEIQKAKDYLTKAYNLYKSIGAKSEADDAMNSLKEMEAQKTDVNKDEGVKDSKK